MALDVQITHDFGGARRIINLPDGITDQEPATVAQLKSAVEGINWKDSVRVSTQGNINLAAPGATIDGITMAANDRFIARSQTAAAEIGIYIWNGAATPATRSLDMNSAAEVEQATATVEEGTNAGVSYRQTAVNVTLGTTPLAFTNFGTAAPSASETTSGTTELATQGEVDTGTDDARAITPLKLANSVWVSRKFAANFGDGSATSFTLTHNLNSFDVDVEVYRNSGNRDTVLCEVRRPTVNTVQIVVDTAPAANAFRAKIST